MTQSKGIRKKPHRPSDLVQRERDMKVKVKEFIDDKIENVLFIDEIDRASTMYDSGVDSLDAVELQTIIEKEFNVTFEHGDFDIRNSFDFVINRTIQRIIEQNKY